MEKYKVLGQISPPANVLTICYAPLCNVNVTAIVKSITIANRSPVDTLFRVAISIGENITSPKQYIFYDVPIEGNETMLVEVDIPMNNKDTLRVYNQLATCSFNVIGIEITE